MKFNPTRLLLFGLVAALTTPVFAQDSTPSTNAPASSSAPSSTSAGADIFKVRCVMCHGADGTGDTPAGKMFKAASLKDPMVTAKSNDELHTVIKNGKNKMPSFKSQLTDEQIDSVIAYIRTLPQ